MNMVLRTYRYTLPAINIFFFLLLADLVLGNVVKAASMGPAVNPDSLAKTMDDPTMDSVYLQRPKVGGGFETRVDTLGIHPYYMNIIAAGGPASPYHGNWAFTPTDPIASSHAHWYLGGGAPDKGLHAIEADSVANFWDSNYPNYFNNNGTPDLDWETVTILNKNWPGNDDIPLPVELTPNSFIASYNKGLLNLKWRTDTEVSNYGFEIYKTVLDESKNVVESKDKIGFVPGNGNSNSPKNYAFTDPEREFGVGNTHIYQLRQIDNDGQYEDLSPLEVNIGKEFLGPGGFEMMNPYPNPFNPMTNLTYKVIDETPIKVTAYNSLGEEVKVLVDEVQKPGIYTIQFNADLNASGPYFFKIDAPGFSETKKGMLNK